MICKDLIQSYYLSQFSLFNFCHKSFDLFSFKSNMSCQELTIFSNVCHIIIEFTDEVCLQFSASCLAKQSSSTS